jgi:hypothetical protein
MNFERKDISFILQKFIVYMLVGLKLGNHKLKDDKLPDWSVPKAVRL